MAEHEQSSRKEFADLFDLNLLSEAQLDDVVGGAHSFGDIWNASIPWYDLYRQKDQMSPEEAMKNVYENNLSAADKLVVRDVLKLRGVDIE